MRGKKKPSGEPGTPVSQGKEIRAGEVYGSTVRFRLPDKRRGTLSGGTGNGKFRRTAEAPCGGTDGCVPFVLPPDVRLRPCSLTEWSETDAGTGQPVRQGAYMAGVDSGGEGQNPKYVALLAGFAMLYMQQSNRDSKIRLVLLDEAFSKMDKERSEVCLKYARELELQLIVCVPDERLQSLIRNVDSVYGFRRFRNQVTMMHIDKGNYLDMIAGESRSEEV